MAFRRKDVKKASYYLWFLGAMESKGLRGEEFVVPVLRFLLDKEKEMEPSKVTLQVSSKGLKIIQNVPKRSNKSNVIVTSFTKTEQIKHFIPHHAITCAFQDEDVVCCILLIYNPMTKCPVHVHAYRCDSIETASALRSQLQTLIDRPENQRKFREIESRLLIKGLTPKVPDVLLLPPTKGAKTSATLHSDGRSTRTEGSEDSYESCQSGKEFKNSLETNSHENAKVAILYESLAAELKAKLNPKSGPILLPPRDYDTMSRKQGKLNAIERRKSTNTQVVGVLNQTGQVEDQPKPKTRSESSGKSSSGIGSDEALPIIQEISPDYTEKYESFSSDEERDWSPDGHSEWTPASRKAYAQCQNRSVAPPTTPKTRSGPWIKGCETRKQKSELDATPHYYFPDPGFSVTGTKQDQNRLKRQQSTPDCFKQMKSSSFSENSRDAAGYNYRNSLSPEPFRLHALNDSSEFKHRPKTGRVKSDFRESPHRHSFIESCLHRPNISY